MTKNDLDARQLLKVALATKGFTPQRFPGSTGFFIDGPSSPTHRRLRWSPEDGKAVATCVQDFLKGSGYDAVFQDGVWFGEAERDRIYIYTDGTRCDPHGADPVTVAVPDHALRQLRAALG